MAQRPVHFGAIKTSICQIQNADALNLVTLYTASANGGKVEAIAISSSDTVARDISLVVSKGGIDCVVGSAAIAALAGQVAATLAVDGLSLAVYPWLRQDENGNRFLLLDGGCVLKVKSLTTVTATKALQFLAQAREV